MSISSEARIKNSRSAQKIYETNSERDDMPNNSNHSEEDEVYVDEAEEMNDEKKQAAVPKKRGRPRKPATTNPVVRGGSAKLVAIDKVVGASMKTLAVSVILEKIKKKNKIESQRIAKGGIKIVEDSVMENYVNAIEDMVAEGTDDETVITAEGLESFKEKCLVSSAIHDGLNGLVQIGITAVDLLVLCDRGIFSNVKGSGLTNLIQSMMSKL